MSLSCVSCGVTEMACSCWQLDRVDIDPRRSTVGFGDQNDVESFFSFTIIKIDLGQFPLLFDVFLAINLGMSRKGRGADRELNRAVGGGVADCLLACGHFHVKINTRKFGQQRRRCIGPPNTFRNLLSVILTITLSDNCCAANFAERELALCHPKTVRSPQLPLQSFSPKLLRSLLRKVSSSFPQNPGRAEYF